MKVLVFAVVFFLAIIASLALGASVERAMPKDFKDPALVRIAPAVVPFGNFNDMRDSEIRDLLNKNFPLLLSNSSGKYSDKEYKARLQAEASRWVILQKSLAFRNQKGDERAARLMTAGWECTACTFCVGKLKGYLNDGGCDLAADYLGDICASIPIVGAFSIPVCVEVLKWGCGKILDYIEDNPYTSDNAVCNEVFGLSCGSSGGSSSAGSPSGASGSW